MNVHTTIIAYILRKTKPILRIFAENRRPNLRNGEVMQAAQKTRTALRGFTIGALIGRIRLQLGMSQKVLAMRAGIPQSTVSRVESRSGKYHQGADKILRALLPSRSYAQFRRLKCASLVMDQLVPPPVEQFLVTDPSEAVRSEEILPVLTNHFHIECQRPQGGTLVAPLLGRLVANFLHDEEGSRWADLILADERAAIDHGTLPSDLVAILAQVS